LWLAAVLRQSARGGHVREANRTAERQLTTR
jgi:hypothetical protein